MSLSRLIPRFRFAASMLQVWKHAEENVDRSQELLDDARKYAHLWLRREAVSDLDPGELRDLNDQQRAELREAKGRFIELAAKLPSNSEPPTAGQLSDGELQAAIDAFVTIYRNIRDYVSLELLSVHKKLTDFVNSYTDQGFIYDHGISGSTRINTLHGEDVLGDPVVWVKVVLDNSKNGKLQLNHEEWNSFSRRFEDLIVDDLKDDKVLIIPVACTYQELSTIAQAVLGGE